MHRQRNLCVAGAVFALATVCGVAQGAFSAASGASVAFAASGPAGMAIQGKTSDFALADQGEALVITVPLANLSTGISLRDRHMREKYLEVQKYPTATLNVARSALKVPAADDGKVESDVPGTVTLHGQTRPIVVHYEVKKDGTKFASRGQFRINMQEFGIAVPSYLGITVKPDVDVTANFQVGGP